MAAVLANVGICEEVYLRTGGAPAGFMVTGIWEEDRGEEATSILVKGVYPCSARHSAGDSTEPSTECFRSSTLGAELLVF